MYLQMKSLVFSLKKSKFRNKSLKRITLTDVRFFLKRYGITVLFSAVLLFGLASGSVYAQSSDTGFIDSLDFLFTTNLDARLAQNPAGTFCACFASDFIFLFSAFLLGLSPWGAFILPFLLMFKGFGTGITAGYLFSVHQFAGVGFYLLILLPGTFLFCAALIKFCSKAFVFSKDMISSVFGKYPQSVSMRGRTLALASQFTASLIISFLAALTDAALWTFLAGMFDF